MSIPRLVFAAALAMAAGQNVSAANLALGFNLTHVAVHCPHGAPANPARRPAGVLASDNIVVNYGDAAVRARTRNILARMHGQGASFVRTLLWFRDTTHDERPSPADGLGLLRIRNGTVAATDLSNIASYTTDVRRAGYGMLVLAAGPLLEASPKCRRAEFGDCFDPASLSRTWSALAQIKRAVAPLSGHGFRVLMDLGNEDCPERSRQPIGTTMAEYARYIIGRYVQTFHDRDFLLSCGGGSSAAQGLNRLVDLTALYRQMRARPAGLDLHMYFEDAGQYATALDGERAGASELGVSSFVLETYLDNRALFDALRHAPPGDKPTMVAVWPLKHDGICQMSESAPYQLPLPLDRRDGLQ